MCPAGPACAAVAATAAAAAAGFVGEEDDGTPAIAGECELLKPGIFNAVSMRFSRRSMDPSAVRIAASWLCGNPSSAMAGSAGLFWGVLRCLAGSFAPRKPVLSGGFCWRMCALCLALEPASLGPAGPVRWVSFAIPSIQVSQNKSWLR